MRNKALFINGVYDEVLHDIAVTQNAVPEQVLYLQPYSENRIVQLYKWTPSLEAPVVAYFSTTADFSTVAYVADIVGIRDKTNLSETVRDVISKVIGQLQPTEDGVYQHVNGKECHNLLSVLRMRKVPKPFPVTELTLLNTSEHPSGPRTTAGGWWYVQWVDVERIV